MREKWLRQNEMVDAVRSVVRSKKLEAGVVNPYLSSAGEDTVIETTAIEKLARRPTLEMRPLLELEGSIPSSVLDEHYAAVHQVQVESRYSGYIDKQLSEVDRFKEIENKVIPDAFEYDRVQSLSTEAREKLQRIQPASLGQASRIPGVSASDVSILAVYLR